MWYILILSLTVSSYVDSSSSAAQLSRHKRNDESEPWKNPDLPNTIEPILYNLFISPHFYNNGTTFYGNVSIDINVLNRTNVFIVHMKQLTITRWRVYDSNGESVARNDSLNWTKNEYFVMRTKEPLHGRAKLQLYFNGNMTFVKRFADSRSGLYNIRYVNETGEESWLLVTDFGQRDARMVFPCFDEPRFKAQFKITLHHWDTFTALSNMPMESQTLDGESTFLTAFKLSPNMSSFLVGFALTDFRSKNKTVDGKQHSVWARPDLLERVNYTLDVTPTIISYLHQELDMPYSLEKLDQLAVPEELLGDNQRENGGLSTYKESKLLFDVKNDGDFAKHDALAHIAKSLAHNYFGNVVTCRYWEHVWLNEGLATFYEVLAVTEVDPTFLHKEFQYGWNLESPMKTDASNGDALIYPSYNSEFAEGTKGAAILRMVENFISADTFKRGIRQYLTRHANGTVVTDNLWLALQRLVDGRYNMKLIMTNWVEKSGFPVIKVELLNGNRINATQKHFLSEPFEDSDENTKWFVPLTYRAEGKNQQMIWMNQTDVVFDLPEFSSDDWIEFNCDRTGYYRVNYDANLWERIRKQLNENHTVFSQLTRSAMLGDAAALAKADQLGYDEFLNLTTYAAKEKDLIPWLHMYEGFQEMLRIYNTTILRPFQNYLFNITKNLMDRLQVKDAGTYIEKQLRPKIMMTACYTGHIGCVDNTTRIFKAWIRNETNAVPKNFRHEAYCIGLAFSKVESEWYTAFERYKRAKPREEQIRLLKALTCSRNVTILNRLLDLSINGTLVNKVDAMAFITFTAVNPTSGRVAWDWLKRNYSAVFEARGEEFAEHSVLVATYYFNTQPQYQEVLDFYEVHHNTSEFSKNSTIENLEYNIRWRDRNLGPITTWLKTKK